MSVSDREPGRFTNGEPVLLASVTCSATGSARARSAQLLKVKPAHLAVIEGDLNMGVAVDGDSGDLG